MLTDIVDYNSWVEDEKAARQVKNLVKDKPDLVLAEGKTRLF
jgi:hypothetical protein